MANQAAAQAMLVALREQIARVEGRTVPSPGVALQTEAEFRSEWQKDETRQARLPLQVPRIDDLLEGGLPLDGMTEIRSRRMADAGAVSGFALSLAAYIRSGGSGGPVLWIGDVVCTMEAGLPYGVGLQQFGLEPENFLYASPRKLVDALWLADAALASGALAATILEIPGNPKHFGLTESRRLSLRAKASGSPLFLLRHGGEEEAGSACFRFLAEAAPALGRRLPDGSVLGGSIGHPVFQLTLEKSRNPAPFSFLLEWNPHDRQFSLGESAAEHAASRKPEAHSGPCLPASADRPGGPNIMGAVLAYDRAS
jgi:protein ImuA